MKKILSIIIVSMMILIPSNTYATQLLCNLDNKIQGDKFDCLLVMNEDLAYANFDKLQGTLTATSGISCKYSSYSINLHEKETSTKTFMDIEGTPVTNTVATIDCEVTDNPSADITTAQVFINDLKYHVFNSGTNESSEMLSSDFFTIEHKKDENSKEASNEKPRGTTNADSRLKSITDENLSITFSQFYTEYSVEVLYDVEELNIKAVPNNSEATVEIKGNQKLEVGNNTIDIYVTSPDGTSVTCYTLYVKRLARGEDIYYSESDSTLKSLKVTGYTISFEKDVYEYKIHLASNVDSVTVLTEATSENATINVSNTTGLKNGNTIVITVTSADKSTSTTYKIKVTKDAPKRDYSQVLIIIGIILAIALVITAFILTSKKKEGDDPLLSLKHKKRKLNKGKKFDNSQVEDVTITADANTTVPQTDALSAPVQDQPVVQPQEVAQPVQTPQIAPEQTIQQPVQQTVVQQAPVQQTVQTVPQQVVQQVVTNQPQVQQVQVQTQQNINQ